MSKNDLISSEAILTNLDSDSKKKVIQAIASEASKICNLSESEIFETLLKRERLGPTAVGHGVAIPHGKLNKLDQIVGLFAKLKSPIDFDSLEEQPVDLIFVLLAPESAGADHLKALSRIARVLRNDEIATKLRESSSKNEIFKILTTALEESPAS